MSLPAELAQIPVVQRTYVYRDGTPVANKKITLELATEISVGLSTIVPKRLTIRLDENGQVPADTTLPSTNDPDASIVGLAYTVTEHWTDGRSGLLVVPYDAVSVDLADLVDSAPSPEYTAATAAAVSAAAAAASEAAAGASETAAAASEAAAAASESAAASSASTASAAATTATTKATEAAASAQAASDSADAAAASALEAAAAVVSAVQGDGVKKVKVVAGVIRNTGSGWAVIDDANHNPINVTSVSSNTTGVTVNFSGIGATKILSFVCGPDEKMSQAGMTCGASVSTTSAGIWIAAPLTFYVDPATGTFNAPAWFDPATFSISGSGATRTITHPDVSDAKCPPVLSGSFASSLIGPTYYSSSFTTTGFTLNSMTDLAGRVYYSAGAWNVQTGVDTSTHTISTAWEAANGGQLRITHPDVENQYAVNAVSYTDGYRLVVNGVSATSFTVKFFDTATNTQVSSPASGMGLYFSRPRKCRAASLISGRVAVHRGQARLDPTLLTDATLPLANIWFVGVFEVA